MQEPRSDPMRPRLDTSFLLFESRSGIPAGSRGPRRLGRVLFLVHRAADGWLALDLAGPVTERFVPRSGTQPPEIEPRIEPEIEPEIERRIGQRIGPRIGPGIEPRIELRIRPRIEPRVEPAIEPRIEIVRGGDSFPDRILPLYALDGDPESFGGLRVPGPGGVRFGLGGDLDRLLRTALGTATRGRCSRPRLRLFRGLSHLSCRSRAVPEGSMLVRATPELVFETRPDALWEEAACLT